MNDADRLGVICLNCGKRLRVKAALCGKRVKCPSCSKSFEVKVDEPAAESGGVAQVTAIQGALIGSAAVAFVFFGLLLFLWLGAESQASGFREQLAVAEQELQAFDELKAQVNTTSQKVVELSKSAEQVKHFEGDNAVLKAHLTKVTKELADTEAALKEALLTVGRKAFEPTKDGGKTDPDVGTNLPPNWRIEKWRSLPDGAYVATIAVYNGTERDFVMVLYYGAAAIASAPEIGIFERGKPAAAMLACIEAALTSAAGANVKLEGNAALNFNQSHVSTELATAVGNDVYSAFGKSPRESQIAAGAVCKGRSASAAARRLDELIDLAKKGLKPPRKTEGGP